MRRWWVQMLVAAAIALPATIALRVGIAWLMGVPPYLTLMRLIYADIPRQVIPVQLVEGEPITFRSRIILKRTYDLNLLVHFDNLAQRDVVDNLMGGAGSRPSNLADSPGKLPTMVRVVVRNQKRQVVHDRIIRSDGRSKWAVYYVGRTLDRMALDEGLYDISVTPLNDVFRLKAFRSELELSYLAN